MLRRQPWLRFARWMTRTGATLVWMLPACCASVALARASVPLQAEVQMHNGRPTIFVNGQPMPMAGYCPMGWTRRYFMKAMPRFYAHKMNYYQLMLPVLHRDLHGTQFWAGDEVAAQPLFTEPEEHMQGFNSIDESAEHVIANDPDAYIVVRFGMTEPKSWRDLHPEQYFLTEEDTRGPSPSLASDLYWETATRFLTCVIRYCESRPWSDRIIGYVNLMPCEGCLVSAIEGWLFDHNPKMVARWRAFLREKYGTVQRLRAAHNDPSLTFETLDVPKDKLRRTIPEVSNLLYWQPASENQPLRDYLELTRKLFHERCQQTFAAMRAGTDRKRFFVYDMFKQTMQGWNCGDFFYKDESRRLAEPDLMAASGSMGVAELYGAPAFDGLLTPHDYQARGPGGIFEPEGIADSTVLRGKLFICEMDLRTYVDRSPAYGQVRNLREYKAVSWRNIATALTRGFYLYWMDLSSDWYAPDEIQEVIARQVQVMKQAIDWRHETVPGIAMVIDDAAVMETNGAGNFLNEAIMWEQKMGLARCGVPYRIYLLQDLALPNFPEHRVFYFPNLFKVDRQRLKLLRKVVFRDGKVVVWGPGSGISDGANVGAESARRLTGFQFRIWPVNFPRRTLICNFNHPVTSGLPADCILGGPLPYGPLLFPEDGTELGLAWTKNGETIAGLAVKEFGRGAKGLHQGAGPLGIGDYAAVFTSAVPLPAQMWRNLARYAGAHVYSDTNDVLLADSSIVALHSLKSGAKRIALPGTYAVTDVISGERVADRTESIQFQLEAPETRIFRLGAPAPKRH